MRSLSTFIKKQDVHGHPIMVNYLGSDSYKTRLGGFLSIVTQVLLLFYFVQQTIDLFMMDDPEIQSY